MKDAWYQSEGKGNIKMNILYLSKLSGNLFAGPNNSVPAQIKAQRVCDNVFWYNLNKVKRKEWEEIGCKNLNDFPTQNLNDLPHPFYNPDIVVIEEFYCHPFSGIIKEIQRKKIPYIIIPRSELTEQAQRKKAIKKKIGNIIYFNSLVRKAILIQYLSRQEQIESEKKWNKSSIVIPNGTEPRTLVKESFSVGEIKAVYIGRYEKNQKGLDILIQVINVLQELLRRNRFILNMYGVDQEKTVQDLRKDIRIMGIKDLVNINDSVFGEEKESILLDSDVFIMTSRFEGMPMGMVEALSYGLPCVATVGTNMTKEIREYGAGWTAENNVESVTNAFRNMLVDKNKLKDLSINAIKLAENYSWSNIAVKSHKLYEQILKNSQRNF